MFLSWSHFTACSRVKLILFTKHEPFLNLKLCKPPQFIQKPSEATHAFISHREFWAHPVTLNKGLLLLSDWHQADHSHLLNICVVVAQSSSNEHTNEHSDTLSWLQKADRLNGSITQLILFRQLHGRCNYKDTDLPSFYCNVLCLKRCQDVEKRLQSHCQNPIYLFF